MTEQIWHKSYSPEVPKRIDFEPVTIPEAFERTVANFPDHCALIMMGKEIKYKDLSEQVNRFAAALIHLGVQKGDKVAIILPNLPQTIIAAQAVFKIGAVVVMHNPLYTERELEYQLTDSDSKVAVCLDLLVPRIVKLKERIGIEVVIACHIRDYLPFPKKQLFPFVKRGMHRKTTSKEDVYDFMNLLRRYTPDSSSQRVSFDDLATLLYTGGTTGVSKGVMLTHANLSINVQQLKAWFFDSEDGTESILGIFPIFHAAGFTVVMNQSVFRGFKIILIPRPDPPAILEMTRKYKPSIFTCVPTIFVGVLNHPDFSKTDFSSFKYTVSGAAPLAADTIREWEKVTCSTIVECYGLSETTLLSHANPWGGKTKPGSVGLPVSDTECRIVDAETGTRDLALGQTGEILLKGPQLTRGYYKKPEETCDAIRDEWFYTGDIGYMDEEGYLFIVDRKKDMIISGGFNIYPREVDEILYEHPKVQDACAVGLPDPYRGETIKAFIVPKAAESLTEEEVIAFCKERLSSYKVPRSVAFMEELPKSFVGKVLRRRLREMELEKGQA
jgi:long-chain acyl-CoA synthetase